MKRIGIVGGTFDPIHFGHLMLGRQAFHEYRLEKIWYMPSRQPPHKRERAITSSEDRVAMVRLAIEDTPYFSLSDFELQRKGGNTYTAETLMLLNRKYPDTEFYFIVGADSIYEIERWYQPETVLSLATILAAERDYADDRLSLDRQIAYLRSKYHAHIFRLHCRELDIASAQIRALVAGGEPVEQLLPKQVEQYIRERGLYRGLSEAGESEIKKKDDRKKDPEYEREYFCNSGASEIEASSDAV